MILTPDCSASSPFLMSVKAIRFPSASVKKALLPPGAMSTVEDVVN
jgi:hypothetical protein